MAFVHATGNFAEELWPGIAKHWGTSYKDYPTIYSQVFDMMTSDKAFEKVQQITGFPKAAIKGEGNEAYFTQMYQGYQKEYRHYTYSIGAVVTQELMEDEQYGQIKKIPELLARSMRETEEVVAHNIFNNAFTTGYNGPDGVVLCSTAHPLIGGGTFANRPTNAADLTQTSLESALVAIMDFQDDQGFQILTKAQKLFVPSELYFLAHKLLETQMVVGSADNDKNIVANMSIKPIVSPYLTDADSWFILTDQPGLTWFTRREAKLDRDNDFGTDNLKMKTTKRFSVGFDDWRGVYGVPGA